MWMPAMADGAEPRELSSDMTCPFCGEAGFDPAGLKMHIVFGWCDVAEAIDLREALDGPTPPPPRPSP